MPEAEDLTPPARACVCSACEGRAAAARHFDTLQITSFWSGRTERWTVMVSADGRIRVTATEDSEEAALHACLVELSVVPG